MHQCYRDILDRVPIEPLWFDEAAVPRFCSFSATNVANTHAQEVALALISCQGCRQEFKVAFSELNLAEDLWELSGKKKKISDLIEVGTIHYGDPPNIDCCPMGPVMNSIPVRILEYWFKPLVRGIGVEKGIVVDYSASKFQRDPEFEIYLPARTD